MSDLGDIGGGDPSVGPLLGGATQPIDATARVGVTADTQAISKLKSEFSTLRAELEKVRKEMEGIASASQNISGPGGSATPAAGKIGSTTMAGGTFQAAVPGTQTGGAGGGRLNQLLTTIGGGSRGAGIAAVAGAAGTVVNAGFAAMDARADRGRDYALGADRMSVVYQQMYGMSQNQVANRYRTPMTQYRLGEGGINALMGMQVQTGISALQQASSVEALRTMSGFSISAGQATNMISQLAAPEVANRMFMMAGTGLIGAGGQQRTTTQVIQDLTRAAGLTNENLAKSALTPGSITRANLTMMGVKGDMQDMVIQYAQQNIQYKKAGGRGMYDPSSKEARKLMGIEDNFATQAEETDRLRVSREEQFYKRQADNFADMERQTQTLTKAMGNLEDAVSGVIGKAIGSRVARGAGTAIGGVIGGAVGSLFPVVGTAVGAGLGAAAGNLVGGMFGDPVDGDKPIPYGYGSNKLPISQLSSKSGFSKLHSTFQDRLKQMFADNPAVGFGGGWRDPSYQEKMFRSRYTPTDKETKIFWDGQYWEHTSGAPAAPPGKSMHEIGLAADLVGDLDWVQKHAHEYGLKTFGDVNGEPWHVQPAELPNSRSEYEKQGAPWGNGGAPPAPPDTKTEVGEHSGTVPSAGATGALGTSGIQLSIAEKIEATRAYVSSKRTPSRTKGGSGKSSTKGTTVNASPGSRLSGEEIANLLYAAGFRGQDLVMGVAISKRESGWNSGAHNPNRSTGDDSYGLFQINMMDKLGESRRPWFGISRNEDLFDPMINVSAAKKLYESGKEAKGDGWYHWGGYKGMAGNYSTNMAEAAEIVKSTGLGDPMASFSSPGPKSRGGGVTSVSGNHTFNISPSITINGSASGQDLQQMAREVARLIEKEVRMTTLRSN